MKKFINGPWIKVDPNLWLILIISFFAWAPLLTPTYFFDAHDARHSIFFLVEFNQTFQDGFWWPRWSPDFSFGYGYPLFNLYAPLAFYCAQIIHLLGFDIITSIKTMYVLATIGAGLSMYGFVNRLFGGQAGLLAAVVYMYTPFHLVEIYVRSAYAEFVALALIPLLFWAFTELIAQPNWRRAALSGFVYGLLALTHHSTFFTFSPFLIIYILYLVIAKAQLNVRAIFVRGSYAFLAGLLGMALASIYLIPMIAETRFVKVEQWTSGSYNYLQHFVYLAQFFSPIWGYGYSGPGALDGFSFQLGIVVVALMLLATLMSVVRRIPHYGTVVFFIVATFTIIFMMSPLATTIWQIQPIVALASLVQFPWRLLGMTTFTMAVVVGSLFALAPSQPKTTPKANMSTPMYLLFLVVILASFNYTLPEYTDIPPDAQQPAFVVQWDRASIVDRVGMVSVTEEQPQTSPMEEEYLTYGYPLTVAAIISGEGDLEVLHHGGGSDNVRVIAEQPVTLQFHTYDYPGWRVTIDGQSVPHRPEPPYGLITVDLPAGEHNVWLKMGTTPPRTIGTIVSIVALLSIIFLVARPIFNSQST